MCTRAAAASQALQRVLAQPLRLCPPAPRQTMLGWAWTDRHSYAAFAAEAKAAPAALRPALGLLCMLYGLTRLEAGAECYLSAGNWGPGLAGALLLSLLPCR